MNLGKIVLAFQMLVKMQKTWPTKYLMRKTCSRSPQVV